MTTTEVYWNLHKGGFSVRRDGRVIMHTDRITLHNARFVVQQGGRERTVRERVKRVHAMVRGEIATAWAPRRASAGAISVTYNPYRAAHFQDRATGKNVEAACFVWFSVKDGKPVVLATNGE